MKDGERNERHSLSEYEQRIRETLTIDESSLSGLRWKHCAIPKTRDKEAGCMRSDGYWRVGISINGVEKRFYAHRVIFLLANGRWPNGEIDHINNYPSDNRLANLREANRSENECNKSMRSDNKSGVKGVYFNKENGKWLARIGRERKNIYLGYFSDINDAEAAMRSSREECHGEFANHGIQL